MGDELMHQVKDLFHCTDVEAKTFLDGMLCSSKDVFKKFLEEREEATLRVRILNDSTAAQSFASFINNLHVEVVDLDVQNVHSVGQTTFEESNLIRNWSSVSTLSFTHTHSPDDEVYPSDNNNNGAVTSEGTSEPSIPDEGQHAAQNGEPINFHDDGMEDVNEDIIVPGGLLGQDPMWIQILPEVHDHHVMLQDPLPVVNMDDFRPPENGLVPVGRLQMENNMRPPFQRVQARHHPLQEGSIGQVANRRSLPKLRRRLRPVWKIFVGALHSSLYDTFIVTIRAKFPHHDMKVDTANRAGYCFLYIIDIPTYDEVEEFMAECRLLRVGRNPLYIALAKGNNPRAVVDYVSCFGREH